ncbi:site-specific DNA-methyltransferase [Methylobacter sp. G7]|uniref:site-specific DNA-methyltransferase n=1 Tax=Methylobacter sp. G7 TaxID=3230117 RepID=UPI003D803EE8
MTLSHPYGRYCQYRHSCNIGCSLWVIRKPYDQLKAEYKAIKQQRRHFAVTKHVHYTNVWDFKPVQWYPGKHPCEKPLDLMRHIIEASSKPGDVVLDTFVGSGSTAIACRELGREFVGCEMGDVEFEGAVVRLDR